MKRLHFVIVGLLLFWWFYPSGTYKSTGDLPIKLTYVEKIVGQSSNKLLPMVIVLHGSGGDEKDLLHSLEKVDANFRYIGFRGPIARSPGYRWAKGAGKDASEAAENYSEAMRDVAESISKSVPQLKQRFPTEGRPILFGFSAGAELAMFLAGAYPESFSTVYAISGAFGVEALSEYFSQREQPQVMAYAGTRDTLVSVGSSKKAVAVLEEFGRPVAFQTFDGGHTIPKIALEDLAKELREY